MQYTIKYGCVELNLKYLIKVFQCDISTFIYYTDSLTNRSKGLIKYLGHLLYLTLRVDIARG